jgi:hypothetical protein
MRVMKRPTPRHPRLTRHRARNRVLRLAAPLAVALTLALPLALPTAPAAAGERASHPKTAAGVEAVGRGDHAAAYKLFRSQAARGDAEAQFELSMLYALGKGVERDLIVAYMWAEIAARQKEPYADFIRDEIAANLSGGEITMATGMANDWMRANASPELPFAKAQGRK